MIKVLLIDDEETALDIMGIFLSEFTEVQVCGRYCNPLKALEHLEQERIDAVFLDIEMPGLSGMEVARKISELNKQIQVIFVTAHMDFAVEAFSLESLDYLLKPITKPRLSQAVNRLLKAVPKEEQVDSSISVRCFGQYDVYSHEKHESFAWKTMKVRELCAYLIHHEGEAVDRERIIDILWPNVTVDKAKTSLYTCISFLRKAFKEYGMENIVLKKGFAYYIDQSQLSCDLIKWRNTLKAIEPINGANVSQYEALVNMYPEDYMIDYNWAEEKREYIRKKMLNVCNELSDYYKEIGEIEKAVEYIEKEMQLSRYSDEICQRLIDIYLEMNNRTAALMVYQNFEQLLQEELGIEPSIQTQQLLSKIKG
ncbi:response regulator [Bacillus tianshenii]|nr:response regulator [Bacillus tianshenii]